MWLCKPVILSADWKTSLHRFLAAVTLQYRKSNGKGERRRKSPSSLWKERAVGRGGMRERGEGKHTQTQLCLISSRTERRTDSKPVRPSRRERGEGGREGRGNKCKKADCEKRVKNMHKSCISSCPLRTKNIVFVNGSWWAQAQGECNEKPGRLQSLVLLNTNPLSLCLSLSVSAS